MSQPYDNHKNQRKEIGESRFKTIDDLYDAFFKEFKQFVEINLVDTRQDTITITAMLENEMKLIKEESARRNVGIAPRFEQMISTVEFPREKMYDLMAYRADVAMVKHLRDLAKNFIDEIFSWKRIAEQRTTLPEILKLRNIEQRRAALKIYGVEKLLNDAHGQLLDTTDKGNELWVLKDVFEGGAAYFLKYKDPSTDRIYVSGVDPREIVKNLGKANIPQWRARSLEVLEKANWKGMADKMMGWKFGITVDEYLYGIKAEG